MDISIKRSREMLDRVILIDVRTAGEHQSSHISGSLNIELSRIEFSVADLDKTKEYILYCRSGARSKAAAKLMDSLGYKAYNMAGGIIEWKSRGYPTVDS